jgi:DNA-binding PadR family transcriptional regulator
VALRHAVLAALLEGEASGYELAKRFDVSVANFWHATPQQLYRELDRLGAERLVRSRKVRQTRVPDKRVHVLTPAGRAELERFASAATKPTALRDDLLVKVQAVDAATAGPVADALEERAGYAEAKLRRYEAFLAGLLDGRSEDEYLAEVDRVGPYLTLVRGRAFEAENARWCRWAAGVLRARVPRADRLRHRAAPGRGRRRRAASPTGRAGGRRRAGSSGRRGRRARRPRGRAPTGPPPPGR